MRDYNLPILGLKVNSNWCLNFHKSGVCRHNMDNLHSLRYQTYFGLDVGLALLLSKHTKEMLEEAIRK